MIDEKLKTQKRTKLYLVCWKIKKKKKMEKSRSPFKNEKLIALRA